VAAQAALGKAAVGIVQAGAIFERQGPAGIARVSDLLVDKVLLRVMAAVCSLSDPLPAAKAHRSGSIR